MKKYRIVFIKPSRIQGGLTYLAEKIVIDNNDLSAFDIKAPAGFVPLSITELLEDELIPERPPSELKVIPKFKPD